MYSFWEDYDNAEDIQTRYRICSSNNGDESFWSAHSIIGSSTPIESIGSINVNIYPNPTNSHIMVESEDYNKISQLSFCNAMGQVLKKLDLQSKNMLIDISSYSNGLYLLKVENESRTYTVKVLKQ